MFSPHPVFRRVALYGALCIAFPSRADVAPDTPPTPAPTLAPVVVTGNPLGRRELAAPVSTLSGEELVLRRGTSLGDTLDGLPGVSSSYFGPNANRPAVRGLDGERVRMLGNGAASLDASTLSFDHAVPIDPLVVERLEVLRGPAALLYGGSAIGGVVNALDNRIPRERIVGLSSVAEARLGGAQRERGGAVLLEAGDSNLALHADAFGRQTDDQRVPRFAPVEDGSVLPEANRIRNSASRSAGGALGGSLFFDAGRIGLSADTYDSRYGVVVEPDVTIRMKRDNLGLAGEFRLGDALLHRVRVQLGHTRYEHREIEGTGETGSTFKTSGHELRVEADHAPLGTARGTWGMQVEDFDFSAIGEEAFVPSTRTRRQALFALEELPWDGGTLMAGLRLEHARVQAAGSTARRFSLRSASVSNLLALSPQWSVSGSLSLSERAPTSFELYADGLHAATGTYERGDAALEAERSRHVELALQWKEGTNHWRLGAFSARFPRFIALEGTGNDVVVDGEAVPEYAFRAVRARLHGMEADGRQRLLDGAWRVDATAKLDVTRGTQADSGEPLPRVAPLRGRLGLDAAHGRWGARIELDHAARQSRVPANDVATPAYTLLNLSLSRRFNLAGSDGLWFVQLANAGDALGYNAASIRTVRGLSPLPGRAMKAGVRVAF